VNILIIDDHPLLRAGLARLFAVEFGAVTAEASDAAEGLRCFRASPPDITVLDLNLPGEGGLSLLQTLRGDDPGAKVLVLSMRNDVWSAEAAMRLGAIGYLSKSAEPELILEAIRHARAGTSFVEPPIAEALTAATRGKPNDQLARLSVQELDLLRLLLDGQRTEQIARNLDITEKTVANRKSLLRSKLGAANDMEMLKSARAAGFVTS
jgi:DNA-binding NarL/FixJ family response regulator